MNDIVWFSCSLFWILILLFLKHFDKSSIDRNATAKTVPFMVNVRDFERTIAVKMSPRPKKEISAGTLFIGTSSIAVTTTNYL
jgi:hypothetical protein